MVEITESHLADVGGLEVRRALPRRGRRTVGAWCFVDHFGPVGPEQADLMQVGPHPHMGLQTVTWILKGEVLHRDSLGSVQMIHPGQVNLMTAGRGVSHAEEAQPCSRGMHGAQLWIAQPDETRSAAARFEHLAELPTEEVGAATVQVLVGAQEQVGRSPALIDWPLVGLGISARSGECELATQLLWEHAVVVLSGALLVDGARIEPGHLAYIGPGRSSLSLQAFEPCEALLLGGAPFDTEPLMWWNFVARTWAEVDEARADWAARADRFGRVDSPLSRIDAPPR